MPSACGDCCGVGYVQHLYRHTRVGFRAVAQLSVVVVAPACDGACSSERASVQPATIADACGDCCGVGYAEHFYRYRRVRVVSALAVA